ncbi:MAG TPA: GNAT family protein [Actinomycetes bacterium]
MTPGEADEWYQEQLRLAEDASGRYWVIEVEGTLAGVAFLHSISDADRKARFAVGMFAPELLGRGLGSEATRLVLDHAFGHMGLHRVDLRVLAFNEPAIACYRSCGFVEEGRERESCQLDGVWHDDVIMGVLARQYSAHS